MTNILSLSLFRKRLPEIVGSASVFVVLLLTLGRYGFTDDYANMFIYDGQSWTQTFLNGLAQGRPLLSILARFQYSFIEDINSFFALHFVSIFFYSILTYRLIRLLSRSQKLQLVGFSPNEVAFATSFTMLVSPSFLVLALWGIELIPLISIIAGVIGIELLVSTKSTIAKLSGSFLLLFPLFTYQIAFAFCVAVLFFVLGCEEYGKIAPVLRGFIGKFWLTVLTLGVLLNLFVMSEFGDNTGTRGGLVSDFRGKISWGVQELIPGFWRISPWNRFTISTVLLASLTLICLALFLKNSRSPLQKILLAATLPVATLPNLLTSENWASNRSLIAPQWISLFWATLCIVFLLKRKFLTRDLYKISSLGLATLLAITQVNYVAVLGWKNPQERELRIIREALTATKCEKIRFVRPSHWSDLNTLKLSFDEFGLPSTYPVWSVIPLTKLICLESGVKLSELEILNVELETGDELVDFSQILNDYWRGG